jgi:copper(I)-binding protein
MSTSPALGLDDAGRAIDLLDAAARSLRSAPGRAGSVVHLPARGRLLATGDLHDNPFHFQAIVRLARLGASRDHHVVLHEMIHGERLVNGMDFSHRMLLRAAQLVQAHPGQVHVVLANHELAQLTGRAVGKGAGNSVEHFDAALEYVYGDEWTDVAEAMRGLIRAMPLAVASDGGVFCAHSLPAPGAMARFDATVFDRELTDDDYAAPAGSAHLMVWGRGHTLEQIDALAERLRVRLFCLGHQHVDDGIAIRGKRLVILNSDHERGRVLPVDLAGPPDAEGALLTAIPLAAIVGAG